MNALLWAVFPYVALTLFFVVPFIRMTLRPYEITTRASSLFNRNLLGVASLLLHWGLFLVIAGHIAGFVGGVQGWGVWVGAFFWLGLVGGFMVLAGSIIAISRRLAVPEVRALSQIDDYVVHLFLIAIVGIALYQVVIDQIWGASYTAGAWFASLWRLQPASELMASAPLLSRIHIFLAFAFAAYFPFTKLAHMWTLPINYLVRPYQSMRTTANKFRKRWEFGLRSDQSFLSYSVVAIIVVFVGLAFLLRGPALEAMQTTPAAGSAGDKTPPATPRAGQDYPLFVSQCARCHGLDGKADVYSKDSPRFAQPPRNLTKGAYRFVSTRNRVASRADLRHVIVHGLPSAGMPAFDRLPEDRVDRLVTVIEHLWEDRPEPGPRIETGPVPDFDVAMSERGGKLYRTNCAACHGDKGRGDGPAAASLPVPPANLAAGEVKAGTSPVQLYYRIAAGIPGEETLSMPGYGHLDPEDIWAIVSYLRGEVLPSERRRD